jgi:transcriptional regulator with XRE-family HTH domain
MTPDLAEVIAADLVRELRGRRSCAAFSRRIGYRSNVVRRWEAGESWPTAAAFLQLCARVRPSTRTLFAQFLKRAPAWLDEREPFSPAGIAAFLAELRGKTPIGLLAERTGINRYSIGRWLKGLTQPKLPEFLCLVEASSRRLLDMLAGIGDPERMPTIAGEWRKLCAAREAAYDSPWSHAVLRALELEAYRKATPANALARLARCLGIEMTEAQRGLDSLARSGQIRKVRGKWHVDRVLDVDTSADATRARLLKVAWTRVAADRLGAGAPGSYGYTVFAVARADMRRLRELQLQYVHAMQSLIAESGPAECVGLYCAQLLDLGVTRNALE